MRDHILAALACVSCLSVSGCESTNHENIDKWMRTQKGPGKLRSAFRDDSLSPDLRAHAGQNLIRMDLIEDVSAALVSMRADRREPVMAALATRLWEDARMEGEFAVPTRAQTTAKDALFDLRRFAAGDTAAAVDRYLVEWLTDGYYSARARIGRIRGVTIVRALGAKAAQPLIRRTRSVLQKHTDDGGQFKLEDPLLVGLAATGSPDAVGLLMELSTLQHNDDTLGTRVMQALRTAYVDNGGMFDLADPDALSPHLARLVELAQDDARTNRVINDIIRLIGAVGSPGCIEPLIELMTAGVERENFIWVTANAALQCGKASALVPVADALPRRQKYSERDLSGAIIEPVLTLDDRSAVARQARTLLESKSWVARIIGVELMARVGRADTAAKDAARVRKLARDNTVLRGWWGDQSHLSRKQRKRDPRLGERARQVAAALDQLAKSG